MSYQRARQFNELFNIRQQTAYLRNGVVVVILRWHERGARHRMLEQRRLGVPTVRNDVLVDRTGAWRTQILSDIFQ